jgi:broad specificity phosphatase PhoE
VSLSRLAPPLHAAALLAGVLAVFALLPACTPLAQGRPALVLLVRHAEKATAPAGDPPLTAAGERRAHALADALRDAGVTAIVTTQLRRTRDTAQPLAAALGLTPEVVPVGDEDTAVHARAVADAVRHHGGGVVLVVGHSDSVPAIIAALGGPQLAEICANQYSNLFALVPGGGASGLIRAHYGAPDPAPDADCE